MKTMKIKFLLPVGVFMVAIAAAFATQKNLQEDFAPVQGYIYQNGVCTPNGKCDNSSGPICTDNLGRQVFGKSGQTECLQILRMNWHP
ncbi:MAG: DUF6520 family protein [Aequorivita sp.]